VDGIREYIKDNILSLCRESTYLYIKPQGDVWEVEVVEEFDNKFDAVFHGILREQPAILDYKKQKRINLPNPQKSGTETQKRTYAFLKAMEI